MYLNNESIILQDDLLMLMFDYLVVVLLKQVHLESNLSLVIELNFQDLIDCINDHQQDHLDKLNFQIDFAKIEFSFTD